MLPNSYIFAQFLFATLICWGLSEHQHSCSHEEGETWSYNTLYTNGPPHWSDIYRKCDGHMQSPVNIQTYKVKRDKDLEPLKLTNYDIPITRTLLKNNGHTVIVIPDDGVNRAITVNKMSYYLIQLHFHWGSKVRQGAEHTINGRQYEMELHLVHADNDGRVAVVAFLFQQVYYKNPGLVPIVNLLGEILFKGEEVYTQTHIDLLKIVDNKCSFYRYMGSLTTPSCNEGVIWSVCKKVKYIASSQLNVFRALFSVPRDTEGDLQECKMSDNFRKTQPLNERKITSSK